MPTTTDVTHLTKPVFDTVRTGQELWLETMRIWTELGQRTWPWFFPVADDHERQPLSPAAMIDISFDHARQLLDVQEACLKALLGNGGQPRPRERKAPASATQSRTTAEKTAA